MLNQFIEHLEEQARNHGIYVWGAQGQTGETITEAWIRHMETSAKNADRAIAFWKRQLAEGHGNTLRAFDCSGLGMYFLKNLHGLYKNDMSANGMRGKSREIAKSDLRRGDWVFRLYTSGKSKGKAYHIGYVVDDDLNVIEAKGRDDGVVKRHLTASSATYWNAFGRPDVFAAEIDGESETPEQGWTLGRLLKKTVPHMTGADVKAAQAALIAQGFSCGTSGADGIFGAATNAATHLFQRAHGLTQDGVIGKKTCAALGGTWRA